MDGMNAAVHGWVEDQRWTLARVATLIGRLFHVSCTLREVSYLLQHRLHPQVPKHRAVQRDEDAIADWRATTWARVRGSRRSLWSTLKAGLGNLAVDGVDHLAAIIRNRLKRLQYRPDLIPGYVVQIAFWVTLVFALIERTNTPLKLPEWTVEQLPEDRPGRQIGLTDVAGSIVWLVLVIAYLPMQHFRSFVSDGDGGDLPILDPALWSFWLPFLITVLVASVGLEIAKYRAGRWTWPLFAVKAVLDLAFAVPVVWLLLSDRHGPGEPGTEPDGGQCNLLSAKAVA